MITQKGVVKVTQTRPRTLANQPCTMILCELCQNVSRTALLWRCSNTPNNRPAPCWHLCLAPSLVGYTVYKVLQYGMPCSNVKEPNTFGPLTLDFSEFAIIIASTEGPFAKVVDCPKRCNSLYCTAYNCGSSSATNHSQTVCIWASCALPKAFQAHAMSGKGVKERGLTSCAGYVTACLIAQCQLYR